MNVSFDIALDISRRRPLAYPRITGNGVTVGILGGRPVFRTEIRPLPDEKKNLWEDAGSSSAECHELTGLPKVDPAFFYGARSIDCTT
jgi:hypothetical protein